MTVSELLTKGRELLADIENGANEARWIFEEVKDILLEIDKQTYKLDEMTKVLYLKAWCDYFFYNHHKSRCRPVSVECVCCSLLQT